MPPWQARDAPLALLRSDPALRLLFATTNPGKLRELRRLVAGLAIRVISPAELPVRPPDVEEDGATFAENAEKKAVAYARASGLYALADDSGLCVDALGGEPGVRSARWSEAESPGLEGRARDRANNRRLLRALDGVTERDRKAEYRAVLALAGPEGSVLASVSGVCRGRIGLAPRGRAGFGYDPLFIPAERARAPRGPGRGSAGRAGTARGARERRPPRSERTMAELPPAQKDAISHRGRAFRRMRPVLARLAREARDPTAAGSRPRSPTTRPAAPRFRAIPRA